MKKVCLLALALILALTLGCGLAACSSEDGSDTTAIENFRNVTVTIRMQHDADLGNIVYMKTGDMTDFVCVSMPREDATGAVDWDNIVGAPGLAFKVGGAINGTMDTSPCGQAWERCPLTPP